MASIYTLVTLMRNPYTINPQDISPEMVTSLLEGRIAEAARTPKKLPVQRSDDNIASIIAGLDLSTEAGRLKKRELLQRKKAQVADAADAARKPVRTHGTVSRPDGTTKLGSRDVKIASDEDAIGAQRPEDLENSHNTYDSDDNSIRLELKLRKTKKKFVGQNLGKKSQKPPTAGTLPVGKEAKGVRILTKKNEKVAKHGDLSNLVAAHDVQEENKTWDAVKRTGRAVKSAWKNDRDPNNTDDAVMAGTFGGAAATAATGGNTLAGLATGTALTGAGLTRHLTQTYKGARRRLAQKPAEAPEAEAPEAEAPKPVEEAGELQVGKNLKKVAKMTQSEAERKKIAAQRRAYNDSKVKVESFKQYSEKTYSGLKQRTVPEVPGA